MFLRVKEILQTRRNDRLKVKNEKAKKTRPKGVGTTPASYSARLDKDGVCFPKVNPVFGLQQRNPCPQRVENEKNLDKKWL